MTERAVLTGRLFVALELPPAWSEALAEFQQQAREALSKTLGERLPRLRWVRPEGIHLTLKFLGNVDLDRTGALTESLSLALAATRDARLRLGSVTTFSNRGPPRVLFVGIEGGLAALAGLAGAVDEALAFEGFPRERRAFQPHMTLARLPDEADPTLKRRVIEIAGSVPLKQAAEFRPEEVVLFRSHLERSGARYERLAVLPLVGRG